jgi:hypothetical protein
LTHARRDVRTRVLLRRRRALLTEQPALYVRLCSPRVTDALSMVELALARLCSRIVDAQAG